MPSDKVKLYTAYIKGTKRKIIVEEDLTASAAIRFLNANRRNGIIMFDDVLITKEELINVKDIGSDDQPREDSDASSGGSIFKDTNRELFSFTKDNTE